jgi:transcriptional regulator with XRE-family HTH domain
MSILARISFACIRRNACHVDVWGVIPYVQAMNPSSIYEHIGAVIRSRRKALGMTQEILAGKLRISRGGLANIETGRQNVLVHQLYQFGAVLNLEPSDFLPVQRVSPPLDHSDLPLPSDLKKNQREQIARFFQNTELDGDQRGGDGHAAANKR